VFKDLNGAPGFSWPPRASQTRTSSKLYAKMADLAAAYGAGLHVERAVRDLRPALALHKHLTDGVERAPSVYADGPTKWSTAARLRISLRRDESFRVKEFAPSRPPT